MLLAAVFYVVEVVAEMFRACASMSDSFSSSLLSRQSLIYCRAMIYVACVTGSI